MDVGKINAVIIHSSFCIGGAENMVYELAKSLDIEKVNTTILTLHSKLGSSLEKKVEKAALKNIYVGCEGRVTPGKLLQVYRLIKKQRPDVIHAHMSGVVYGMLWILTHRTKMLVTAHTTPDKAFNKRTTKILKILAKMNKVIMVCVSDENWQSMKSYYGLTNKNVKCVNNGVDLQRYRHEPHEKIVFINVGRHDENKNQKLLIQLFERIHREFEDTRLILCGDGPEHENLIKLSKTLGVDKHIEFTGNIGNVQDYLARADIYVQASHREGLPLSAVEAMASFLPVISTNVGGMKNIVRENGLLIEDYDNKAFYEAMRYMVQNNRERKTMGELSAKIAEEFSSVKMAEDYAKLYEICQ